MPARMMAGMIVKITSSLVLPWNCAAFDQEEDDHRDREDEVPQRIVTLRCVTGGRESALRVLDRAAGANQSDQEEESP